mgnify:CR=1 FL=1
MKNLARFLTKNLYGRISIFAVMTLSILAMHNPHRATRFGIKFLDSSVAII